MESIEFFRLALRDAMELELARAIDSLIASKRVEGQWIEFKAGQLFKTEGAAKDEIRRQISGFANAEGGVLVLGVTEPDPLTGLRTVDGCPPVGGNAHDWVSRVLQDVPTARPRVHPPVAVNGKSVLVIAVDRAPVIVPCPAKRGVVFYLRIGDSTHEVPGWLEADLVLGRRQRPHLTVEGTSSTSRPTATPLRSRCG